VDHFQRIYTYQAAAYHDLIAHEDLEGNLPAALRDVTCFCGKRWLDVATGTGRLPLLLADGAAQVMGVDLYPDVLRLNQAQRRVAGGSWALAQADMCRLPLAPGWAEVITLSWALGHFTRWYGDGWPAPAGQVLREMHRVAAPGAALIIVETLSTGSPTPAPPNQRLAAYYAWLECEWHFCRRVVACDMVFDSVNEAASHMEFFFGPELAARVRAQGWSRLPGWAGMWSKHAGETAL
jgi:ubiquinone/menaquinone biosynthesis C-methylase UbiE